ncbi:MAG: BrnT family toxin [Candidatus Saccharibacteria bacterium]|nr:BrnT family toxin [Candidatus Saccharibacteria bacterium]
MKTLSFEWDETKNRQNIKKHGISFHEATSVFYDGNAILFDDPDHSIKEDRFLIIGISEKLHICIVSHCYREDNNVIRIISARKATKREVDAYDNQEGGLLK